MDEQNFPAQYPKLEEIYGCDQFQTIPISSNKFTIGRALNNTFVIPVIQFSRNHCSIECDDGGQWSVTDTSSFGLVINGEKTTKNIPCPIKEGDSIQFGVDSNKFRYKFTFQHHRLAEPPAKRMRCTSPEAPVQKEDVYNRLKHVEQELQEKAQENEVIRKKLLDTEKSRIQELEELKKRLKEAERYETENVLLSGDLKKVDKQAEEYSKQVKAFQVELDRIKNNLETVNEEKRVLETELTDVRARVQENDELRTQIKSEVLSEIGEMTESELQCSICNESFIETTTLNCTHSFCEYCIMQWKQKQNKCPICRKSISGMHRTLVVDNFISKIFESLSEDARKKRAELIKERKIKVAKSKKIKSIIERFDYMAELSRRSRASGSTLPPGYENLSDYINRPIGTYDLNAQRRPSRDEHGRPVVIDLTTMQEVDPGSDDETNSNRVYVNPDTRTIVFGGSTNTPAERGEIDFMRRMLSDADDMFS